MCGTRRLVLQHSVVALYSVVVACAPSTRYRPPSDLREYRILITRHDSLSQAIGRGLKRRGFTIRSAVQGGSPPTAYLLTFTQREPEPGAGAGASLWLFVRVADTRSGAIVAAVSGPLDSLGATVEARGRAIVDSLVLQRAALRAR